MNTKSHEHNSFKDKGVSNTKFALVLSGGGFNGAFQVGSLKYLSDNWRAITGLATPMKFDLISGVSAGAINGALVAMNELSLLHNLWVNKIGRLGASEIYNSDFIDTHSQSDYLKIRINIKNLAKKFFSKIHLEMSAMDKIALIISQSTRQQVIDKYLQLFYDTVKSQMGEFKAIADNEPLRKKLALYLDRSKIKNTIFTCGFVSLNSGKYHSVKQDDFLSNDDFVGGVLSSSSIPFVWNPVPKVSFNCGQEQILAFNNVDGGVMNVSPLGDVIKLIEEDKEECRYKIFVINCNSGTPKYEDCSESSIGAIISRSFYQLTLTEIFNNDIQHFMQVNDLVKQVEKSGSNLQLKTLNNRPLRSFDAVVISPERGDELGNPLVANEKLIHQRMAQGYQCAKKAIIF